MTARALVPVALAACSFPGSAPAIDGVPGEVDGPPLVIIDADPDQPDAPAVPDAPAPPDAEPDAKVDSSPFASCPPGYNQIIGQPITSSYRFETTQRSWIAAEADCEDDAAGGLYKPGHLVVLDDAGEGMRMIAGPIGIDMINDQWIGLTDLQSEAAPFIYLTSQPVVYVGTPGGDAANQDCVRLKDNGNHDIRDCAETNRYICECDGLDADPARFPNPPDGDP
jgi:hypothetical protein